MNQPAALLGAYSPSVIDGLVSRAIGLMQPGARVLLGIAGSPGSGKTTLAKDVVAGVNARQTGAPAAYLPMDGFHLANATLDALGTHNRKGAMDTFDGWGFLATLQWLLGETDHTVYTPAFDRAVDEPVAGAIPLPSTAHLVVIEGNYLLADVEPWVRIRPLLAESWFVATREAERMRRLVDRHTRNGRTPAEALAWATEVDGANARMIEPTARHAALVVTSEVG